MTESWRRPPTGAGRLLDAALVPLEGMYRLSNALYHGFHSAGALKSATAAIPVISIGNLVVGGAGKTPVAGWLVERLRSHGYRPALLHGGYGADEPALHRERLPGIPVIVGHDRTEGANRALESGADLVILDDGFQHRRLSRDLDIVLVPAEDWSSRPKLLPRGPWREPPKALMRADVIAVTRKTADRAAAGRVAAQAAVFSPNALRTILALRPGRWIRPAGEGRAAGSPNESLAVAAIARPDTFLVNAREAGATVVDSWWFPDHHAYTLEDVERIHARAAGRSLVTTAKDAIKLARFPKLRSDLWVLEQEVAPEDGADALLNRIRNAIER